MLKATCCSTALLACRSGKLLRQNNRGTSLPVLHLTALLACRNSRHTCLKRRMQWPPCCCCQCQVLLISTDCLQVRLADALPKTLLDDIYTCSMKKQTGVSLRYMLDFGANPIGRQLILSAQFLHNELPVRLAHRVAELENLPYGLSAKPHVIKVRAVQLHPGLSQHIDIFTLAHTVAEHYHSPHGLLAKSLTGQVCRRDKGAAQQQKQIATASNELCICSSRMNLSRSHACRLFV